LETNLDTVIDTQLNIELDTIMDTKLDTIMDIKLNTKLDTIVDPIRFTAVDTTLNSHLSEINDSLVRKIVGNVQLMTKKTALFLVLPVAKVSLPQTGFKSLLLENGKRFDKKIIILGQ